MIQGFTGEHVTDQAGKTFAVTGANSGIGFEVCKLLAARGARVLVACRDRAKGDDTIRRIRAEVPDADLAAVELELGDLSSVRSAAERIAQEPRLDGLINNAGIFAPPLGRTRDGFELTFGVNHLGPFALTGLLLDTLEATAGSRIVNTSSNGHWRASIPFDDLHAERSYSRFERYGASKLATLLHTFELDRRLRERDSRVRAVAAHPGGASTDVARHVPKWLIWASAPVGLWFVNSAAEGAWPTLLAATHPDVQGGQYFGPSRFREMRGPAKLVEPSDAALDPESARRLWDVSVELTGVDPGL